MDSAKCVVNGHKVIGNRIIIIIMFAWSKTDYTEAKQDAVVAKEN